MRGSELKFERLRVRIEAGMSMLPDRGPAELIR